MRIFFTTLVVGIVAGCGYAPQSAAPARPRASVHSGASVVAAAVPAPSITGDAQLDALLPTLPPVLWEAGAHVHFGYNPIDCCPFGGYNPEPNDVWVSERALRSGDALAYVTVHELAHSVHLRSDRGAALTARGGGGTGGLAGEPVG